MNESHVDKIFEERISNYSGLAKKYSDRIKKLIETMKDEMKDKIRESRRKNISQYLETLEEWHSEKTTYFNRSLEEIEAIRKAGLKQGQTIYKLIRQIQDALTHSVSQLRADLKFKY